MAALEPGSLFPRLALQDAAGAPVEPPAGETLWGFFKTSCPTCQYTWPYLDRLRERAERSGLSVVAVSQDAREKTQDFNARFSAGMPTLYDPKPWKASDALGITNVPTLFLVGADGRILDTVVGFQKQKMEELAARAAASGGTKSALFRDDESVPAFKPG